MQTSSLPLTSIGIAAHTGFIASTLESTANRIRRSIFRLATLSLICLTVAAKADDVRVTVEDGSIHARGLTGTTIPDSSAYQVIEGPRQGVAGFLSVGVPAEVRGKLEVPLSGRGSLAFWFRTDQAYRSGLEQRKIKQTLVELRGAVSVSFEVEKQMVTIFVKWAGDVPNSRHIWIQLPEFPGPEWHHIALTWNGEKGEMNAFLDGTPYYPAGEALGPWSAGEATELIVPLGRLALADMRVQAGRITGEEVLSEVGKSMAGRLNTLLGARDLPVFSSEERRGRLLYENSLATATDIKGWKLEGKGVLEFADGWMQMKSAQPEGPEGHFVLWCPEEFPESFQAEWNFEIFDQHGLCIVFFAARGSNGRDIFHPSLASRDGLFGRYIKGDINCYHISYFANTPDSPRPVANLRKNSGFFLMSNGPVGVSSAGIGAGKTHRAVLRKDGPHIRMSVDERTIIDFTDDGLRAGPVWDGGKIGLRQMQWTVARYRNFRVYAVPGSDN